MDDVFIIYIGVALASFILIVGRFIKHSGNKRKIITKHQWIPSPHTSTAFYCKNCHETVFLSDDGKIFQKIKDNLEKNNLKQHLKKNVRKGQ